MVCGGNFVKFKHFNNKTTVIESQTPQVVQTGLDRQLLLSHKKKNKKIVLN